jgi:sugar (pentulose or hexulose) kinase
MYGKSVLAVKLAALIITKNTRVKKVLIRLCAAGAIGLIMTACHHDEKKAEEVTMPVTDTAVAAPKPDSEREEEQKEHENKTEPTQMHKDSLKVDKGMR